VLFNAVIPARLHRYAKHCGQAEAGIQHFRHGRICLWHEIFSGFPIKSGMTITPQD